MKLLKVALVAHILTSAFVMGKFPEKKYDCSAILETSILGSYKEICHWIHDWKPVYTKMTVTNRLDIVETCTCNLLRHTMAWQAMLTHEVESLFIVTQQLVSKGSDVKGANSEDPVVEDEYMYFWDKINAILRENAPKQEQQTNNPALTNQILEIFGDTYYNPDTFTLPYKGQPQNFGLRRVISTTCNQLLDQFKIFLNYFNNLRQMSENPRFVYRVVTYDEALFKIMSVMKVCHYLFITGDLI